MIMPRPKDRWDVLKIKAHIRETKKFQARILWDMILIATLGMIFLFAGCNFDFNINAPIDVPQQITLQKIETGLHPPEHKNDTGFWKFGEDGITLYYWDLTGKVSKKLEIPQQSHPSNEKQRTSIAILTDKIAFFSVRYQPYTGSIAWVSLSDRYELNLETLQYHPIQTRMQLHRGIEPLYDHPRVREVIQFTFVEDYPENGWLGRDWSGFKRDRVNLEPIGTRWATLHSGHGHYVLIWDRISGEYRHDLTFRVDYPQWRIVRGTSRYNAVWILDVLDWTYYRHDIP